MDDDKPEMLIDGVIGWDVTGRDIHTFLKDNAGEDVVFKVSSPGGLIREGLAMHSYMKAHRGNVQMDIVSIAASMATVISTAADKVRISPMASYMVHRAQGYAGGNAKKMRNTADVLDKMDASLELAYGMKIEVNDDFRSKLDNETWFSAQEVVDLGLVDELIDMDDDGESNLELTESSIAFMKMAFKKDQLPAELAAVVEGFDFEGLSDDKKKEFEGFAMFGDPGVDAQALNSFVDSFEKPKGASTKKVSVKPASRAQSTQKEIKMDKDEKDTSPTGAEVNVVVDQAVAQDRERVAEIDEVFAKYPEQSELKAKCVKEGTSITEAKALIWDALGKDVEPVNNPAHVTVTNNMDFDALLGDAMFAKYEKNHVVKNPLDDKAKEAMNHNPFRAGKISSAARVWLKEGGTNAAEVDLMTTAEVIERAMDPVNMVTPSQGGSSFPNTFTKGIQRILLDAYMAVGNEAVEKLCRPLTVPDYKPVTILRFAGVSDLDKMGPQDEYRSEDLKEHSGDFQIEKFGKEVNLSRPILLSDDLGALIQMVQEMGGVAKEKEGQVFIDTLTKSGTKTLLENTALFMASNKVAAASMDTDGVTKAAAKLRRQKRLNKRPMMAKGRYLFTPVTLEHKAETVTMSETVVDANGGQFLNIHFRKYQVCSDPRLDDKAENVWYLFSDPMHSEGFAIARLDGMEEPVVFMMPKWSTDGACWKVRHEFVIIPIDRRGQIQATTA